MDFDLVVNTIALPELAPRFEGLPTDVAADIAALEPVSLVNVLVGMKADKPLQDLSWIYLPFEDQGVTNRLTFFSNYSPLNAPEGHTSYMAEATYRGNLDVSQDWIDQLVSGLEHAGVLRRSDVTVTEHWKSRYAYIDQNIEFPARIQRVREWFDASGMLTVGRFGRYEYHNSDQCIMRAFEAVKQIETLSQSGIVEPFVFS